MELHQIRYFLALAEELNFTRAAENCSVSQPTMSRAIRQLEHELGEPLFMRDRSQTYLTEFGRMMRPFLEQIWQQTTEAKQQAANYAKSERAVLQIGMMCTIAPSALMELVRVMRSSHPGIELQITDAPAGTLNDLLATGALDVAILSQPEPFSERLHNVPLYREPFVIAVSRDSPFAGQDSIRVCQLDGQDYLERINCEFAAAAADIFNQQGVRDRTVYKTDRDDWILAMAAAGLGYSFIPERCVAHADVVALRLVEPEIWREISLVTVRGRPYSTPLGALVREATRLFRKAPHGIAGPIAEDAVTTGEEDGLL